MTGQPLEDDGEDMHFGEAPTPTPPAAGQPEPSSGVLGPVWRWLGEQDWPDDKPPPRRWLLKRPGGPQESNADYGFLPAGKLGMLAAAGGQGKTMALAQLAVSVITGKPWLGHYAVPVESRGPVLLALGEEDADEVQRRLYEIRRGLELSADELADVKRCLLVLPLAGTDVQLVAAKDRNGRPEETRFYRELRQRLGDAAVDWRLLVLDPLSRWAGPETETDNFAATRFVSAIEALTQVRGNPTVLLSHHTTKAARTGTGPSDATAARGASALTDGVRWVANLVAQDGGLCLSLVKTNYTAPAEPCPLKRLDGGVLRVLTRAEIDAQGKQSKANGKTKKSAAKEPEESEDDPNQAAF